LGPLVYVDAVVLANSLVNALLLWAAARLAGVRFRPWRLALAALVGGAYSLALYVPGGEVVCGLWGKLAVSVIMVLVAFLPATAAGLLKLTACLYCVAFTFAGCAFAVASFVRAPAPAGVGPFYVELDSWRLALALGAGAAVVAVAWRVVGPRLWPGLLYVGLEISLGGRTARLVGLVDSGNRLRDPLTGAPVIIVEYEAMSHLVPAELRAAFEGPGSDPVGYVGRAAQPGSPWASRLRVLPYRSIGKKDGMMVGLRPDGVALAGAGGPDCGRAAVIGIYPRPLGSDARYQALVPLDLVEGGGRRARGDARAG